GFNPEPYGIGYWPEVTFDHTPDYTQEIKTDSNKAPKSPSPKAPPSLQDHPALPPVEQKVAKPNNYMAMMGVKQEIAGMLDVNLINRYPNYFSSPLNGVMMPGLYSSAPASSSDLTGWIFENQGNWKGKAGIAFFQESDQVLKKLVPAFNQSAVMA